MVKTSDFESGNSGSSPGEAASNWPPSYKIMLNDFGQALWTRGSAPEDVYDGEVDMTSPRRELTIRLKEWDASFCCSLSEFVAELTAILESAPEAERAGLMIDFDRYGDDYDTSRGDLEVYYQRPETNEELEARLRREMTSKLQEEARSRREYERLKAKFEK